MSTLLVFSAKIVLKHSKTVLFYSKLGVLIRVKTSSSHMSIIRVLIRVLI